MCIHTIYVGKSFTVIENKLMLQGLNGDAVKFHSGQIRKIESGYNNEMKWVLTITSMKGNTWEFRFNQPMMDKLEDILLWYKGEVECVN